MSALAHPVRLDGVRDQQLSRWLWLVKWILVIPHVILLAFLWLAFALLSVVAFFAIAVTGRYPRSIFDFNLGVLRWTWRVSFYSYSALGTDRYPPFSLREEPDYPAQLHVPYPEHLSRGLVWVKWWLLALPHYLIVALFIGGGFWFVGRSEDVSFGGGLIALLVLIAGVALLFTGRYPSQLFDFILGLNRWVMRVAAYAGLMTDAYPPFRIDLGPRDPGTVTIDRQAPEAVQGGRATAQEPPEWSPGRTVLAVLAGLATLIAMGLLLAGAGVLWADGTQRDRDGFLMTPTEHFTTGAYAMSSERVELWVDQPGWLNASDVLGTVRVRSTSATDLFVGVATAADARAFLAGVDHDVVRDLGSPQDRRVHRAGGAPADPADAGIWVATASGRGEQVLDWRSREGEWAFVVMNADGSRGVDATLRAGAELDDLNWIGWGILGAGVMVLAAGAVMLAIALRRGPRAPAAPGAG